MSNHKFALGLATASIIPILLFAVLWMSLLVLLGLMWVANAVGFI